MEVGDSFFCWTEENLTRKHGIRLLEALTDKFGEALVVFLERVTATRGISGSMREVSVRLKLSPTVSVSYVRGKDLEIWYFPSKFPELNAIEGFWDQL
ncbi:hypothetical protein GWG54_09715 [Natronococcus sp. JC468]|uniref:transposase n=1 Tax=Natronococcus sp. JC468 TaxID=1961921 RepID=UPI00143AAC4D|nr:hypothetical protein [Natronococcus sp. JC468]